MTAQAAHPHSRRGAGRPRSTNESKARNNESSRAGKDKDKSQTDKASETTKSETAKPAKSKPQNEGEKLVVRRLPPAMTEHEFASILGPEWAVNQGKVDWYSFAAGKISKDPSKPSRPGRAYLHLIRKEDIMALSEAVRAAKWEDAKGSFNDPSLIAPPGVEFAIYKKVPNSKKRNDARQGTIDQDPQFMAFLEELANPPPPREVAEGEGGEDGDKTDVKVTTTPLIEFLKEKKANKGKEAATKSTKSAKSESKAKGAAKEEEPQQASSKKKGKAAKEEKASKAAGTPKESVKILTKKAATEQAAEAAKNVANQLAGVVPTAAAAATPAAQPTPVSASSSSEAAPKTRRAGIAAAARILQRDLGLSPGSAHRRARQDAAKAESGQKASDDKEKDSTAAGAAPAVAAAVNTERPASPAPSEGSQAQAPKGAGISASKSQGGRRNRGGKNADKNKVTPEASNSQQAATPPKPMMILKKPDVAAAAPASPLEAKEEPVKPVLTSAASPAAKPVQTKGKAGQNQQKKAPALSADATQAFIKHVNASQGVNEAALRQVLGAFGTITGVEVDKRKGFAFVDFSDHDALVKAIHASPITIGQTTVQVLERKEKKPAVPAAAAATTAMPAGAAASSGNADKPDKPEKSSGGRGRRGRGGGGGNKASAGSGEKAQAGAASQPPTAAKPGG